MKYERVEEPKLKGVKNILMYGAFAFAIAGAFLLGWILHTPPTLEDYNQKYPFIDVARHFVDQEHFISTLQPLREDLQKIVDKHGGSDAISIYIEYLNTGGNISINQNLRVFPASLVKVPLAMAVMKKIERGEWELSSELVLMKEDRDTNWGTVFEHPIGTRLTIEYLLNEMLIHSDNTAYRMMYRNLSFAELRDVVDATGLTQLFDEEGKITAKEYSSLFRSLYTSSYLKREGSQYLLTLLAKTTYEEYLGQGIPDDVPFAHKIGENEDVRAILDSGIVYIKNRPFLITMMMDAGHPSIHGREVALSLFRQVAASSYEYVRAYENK